MLTVSHMMEHGTFAGSNKIQLQPSNLTPQTSIGLHFIAIAISESWRKNFKQQKLEISSISRSQSWKLIVNTKKIQINSNEN